MTRISFRRGVLVAAMSLVSINLFGDDQALPFDQARLDAVVRSARESGDADAGRLVFFSKRAGCQTCHRGRDVVELVSASLSDDGLEVTLHFEENVPAIDADQLRSHRK